jgi:acetyl/propionyl-CoA carboxylase alpha subunit
MPMFNPTSQSVFGRRATRAFRLVRLTRQDLRPRLERPVLPFRPWGRSVTEAEDQIRRVLIANRGEIARRLIRHYADRDVETAVVFSAADADQSYLDACDYPVYLPARTVSETYLNPQRVVSAALDAGCDAVHPGYCFLAEHLGFYEASRGANLPVIGAPAAVLPNVVDRPRLFQVARGLGIPLIPHSSAVEEEEDGAAAAAMVGTPLFVKAVHGKVMVHAPTPPDVPIALRDARARSLIETGDSEVYLERAVETARQIGVVIAADRHGTCVCLGVADDSLELHYCTWVEEIGQVVAPPLLKRLSEASVKLAQAVRWVGIGTVRWAVTPQGGWYLLGFSARLTTGFNLVEAVQGVDLLDAQFTALFGGALGWEANLPERHGIQARIFHIDPRTGLRPPGSLDRLDLPEDCEVDVGLDVASACDEDTEPLIAKLTVTAPTRQAAIVRMRAALERTRVEGVESNLGVLRQLFGHRDVWARGADVGTLRDLLGA